MAGPADTAALHGRHVELERLDAGFDRVATGRRHVVLIEGEAGIGKSRLLHAALERARERGFVTFLGSGDEIGRARPFGPISEALCRDVDPRSAHVARLLAAAPTGGGDPIDPTGDPGLQFRVVDEFGDLVEAAGLSGPVVVAIDDLQWADPSTLLTLHVIAQRVAHLPVALLVTIRSAHRSAEVERLADRWLRDGADRLVLGPLDHRTVDQVVCHRLRAAPSERLREKVAGAAGNPLFVVELLDVLTDAGGVVVTDGRADLVDVALPPSFRLAILRRLAFLGESTGELLRTACALGSTFSIRDVATVMTRSATDLLGPVHEAIAANVLDERGDRLGFRHDLVREAIYTEMPPDVRAALHLDVGRKLAASGAPVLRVAEQFALGARPGDADALGWLHAAAQEVAGRSPVSAVRLLERALELCDDDRDDHRDQDDDDHLRARLTADLVTSLLWAGQPARAETCARAALARHPARELDEVVRLALVGALTAQGRADVVVDEVAHTLRCADLSTDTRSRLQAEAANALGFLGDLDAAERAARDAVATGTPVDSVGVELGLVVLSDIARARGLLHESLAHAERARDRAVARRDSRLGWRPEIFCAMALRSLDRFDDAHDALRRGRLADERRGNVSYLPVYHYESASTHFSAGAWDDAVADAQSGLELADDVGLVMLRTWPLALLALIAVHRDDLEEAKRLLDLVDHRPAEQRPPSDLRSPWLAAARGLLADALGDTAGAIRALDQAWVTDLAHVAVSSRSLIGPDLVRISLAADDRRLATRCADGLDEVAARAPVSSLQATALRCRGLVDEDPELLVRAVALARRGPRVVELASTAQDAATALAHAGRTGEAEALFEEALAGFEAVRAQRSIARVLAVMRGLGFDRRRRSDGTRPAHGWEALTRSELEVVRLAVTGLTNPEIGQRLFISRRTVQTHLAHVFRKLDISSRVELASLAATDPRQLTGERPTAT